MFSRWAILCGLIAGPVTALAVPLMAQVHDGVAFETIAVDYNIPLVDETPFGPFALFEVDENSVEAVELAMQGDPRIVWSEAVEDVPITEADVTSKGGTIAVVGDPKGIYAQNLALLQQIQWNSTTAVGTNAVKVAILDTGLSPYASSIWPATLAVSDSVTPDAEGYDLPNPFYSDYSLENAGAGHGTFVAGLIHALAPTAKLIIEKVADETGHATSWTVIKGLVDAHARGARLANISLGSTVDLVGLENAFKWCAQHNLLAVAPIGNGSAHQALYPSRYDLVACVAGVDGQDHKADFSNWHNRADFCAPATGLKSTYWDGHMVIWSGTSFAAPQITAAFAITLGRGNPRTGEDLIQWMQDRCRSIDGANPAYSGQLGQMIDFKSFQSTRKNRVPPPDAAQD